MSRVQQVFGKDQVRVASPATVTEDFAWYLDQVPGFYFYLGATPPDSDMEVAAPNHSPEFFLDEASLILGVKTLVTLTLDFLEKSTEVS